MRGEEETEGADKKRDVAEDKHYLQPCLRMSVCLLACGDP